MFKNLFGYVDKNLNNVAVKGTDYKTDPKFTPKCILGLAFGASTREDSYNKVLAKAVVDARGYFKNNPPVIVQSEIGECLLKTKADKKFMHLIGESGKESLVFSKVDTYGVLAECKNILDDLNIPYDSVLFLAHPYHMERVLNTARKLGITGKPFMRKTIEWSADDPQLWVRSPYLFVPREIITRIIK